MASANNNHNVDDDDNECDYLVVGGGATGMAFCDTLLAHSTAAGPKIVMVDKHGSPGGQWHDSYGFVRLHQPSFAYGVESRDLEPVDAPKDVPSEDRHRATRTEILKYYDAVREDLSTKHDFTFLGGHALDLSQLEEEFKDEHVRREFDVKDESTGAIRTIKVRKRVVDARNLEPDLPVSTPAKFGCDPAVDLRPVNDLAAAESDGKKKHKHFVVVGGGKTGMDAVHHLLEDRKVAPEDLLWVVPNQAWITARENIGNCMDLLYTAAKIREDEESSGGGGGDGDEKKETDAMAAEAEAAAAPSAGIGPDFFQRAFLRWEKEGHVYRLDPSVVPEKFKDATLSKSELDVLRRAVPDRLVGNGRISEITSDGSMVFADGSILELPFPSVDDTLFLHCSAGAFHCSKSNRSPPPVYSPGKITVQDVYGTPGFCFVGSLIGRLEALPDATDDDRNAMSLRPVPEPSSPSNKKPVVVSGGDVLGAVTGDHPFVQRARNLRAWLSTSVEMREWVINNRLFNLQGTDPDRLADKLDYSLRVLRRNGIEA